MFGVVLGQFDLILIFQIQMECNLFVLRFYLISLQVSNDTGRRQQSGWESKGVRHPSAKLLGGGVTSLPTTTGLSVTRTKGSSVFI